VLIPLPPILEQRAIAAVLSDVDALLDSLERLIIKKQALREGAMQQLLTGKVRLPGFSQPWQEVTVGEIARLSSTRNLAGEALPVLACSKHTGFVDSLRYFKNRVFSKDLTNYRVIGRGEIGYPANHVEEGSIGLQDLYDKALVSPIYVVFAVVDSVNSYFLHRLLKLETYRQRFRNATSASVNRRGSLRWPEFSRITVNIPRIDEQDAVSEVLRDMDMEFKSLIDRRNKIYAIKQGMMQALLTGRIRFVEPAA
jgi:type I restriction enzyme S subunit